MTSFRVGTATDAGRVRNNNEDFSLVGRLCSPSPTAWAATRAVRSRRRPRRADPAGRGHRRECRLVRHGVQLANRAIFERAGDAAELHGMGTTLVRARGSSTAGRPARGLGQRRRLTRLSVPGRELVQLSEDHSLVEDLARDGQLSRTRRPSIRSATSSPARSASTLDVDVDMDTVIPYRGDRFLLCSDGLFNEVDDNRIAGVLRRLADPDEACAELVRLANEHGGRDNITIVLVDVVDDGGRAESASARVGR